MSKKILSREKLDETLVNMFSNEKYAGDYMFYAHMIGQCTLILEEMPAAAGVNFELDHYNLYINPTMFDPLPLVTRLAILKHEMLHILNNHIMRTGERDKKQWNLATDCAINQLIEYDHCQKVTQDDIDKYGVQAAVMGKPMKLGDDAWIHPHTLPVKPNTTVPKKDSSEHYYDLIDQEQCPKEEEQEDCQSCDGSGEQEEDCDSCDGTGQDANGDDCEDCEGSGKKPCPDCNGSGKQQGNGPGGMAGPDDHDKWDQSEGDPDMQKDLTKNMIDTAMENTVKSRGNLPSNYSDYLKMFTRKAEVSWQKVLRGIVGNKKVNSRRTIMRSDRRFPGRDDLRGKTKDRMFNLLVVSDVSGSVSTPALLSLWGEVRHICDVTKSDIDLIQVDTRPSDPEKLSKNTKVMERKACGGTVLAPALEQAKEHRIDYNAIVVTTDGYLSTSDVEVFAKEKKRVIWLIEKDGQIMPEMERGLMKAFKLKE